MNTVKGNKRKQFRHRQKMGEEHLQELGRNSKVQQSSRDQLKAPSRRSSPRQRKSALHAVGSRSRTQPQKGSWTVYHAPPKKERGFTYEQHRNSEQGQRASRAAPHGRRADSRDREHSGRDQGAHDRHCIDADTLTGADYKITWKTVTSSRFDSTAFKKAMPELAERFTKSSTSRRFTVA